MKKDESSKELLEIEVKVDSSEIDIAIKKVEYLVKLFEKVQRLQSGVKNASEKEKWIPVGEQLPEENRWVQVTVKRHHWISNFDDEIFLGEEKIDHPEYIYCTLGRYETLDSKEDIWEFLDLESESECLWTSFTNDCSTEDLSYPMAEVIAWMPVPKTYREDEASVSESDTERGEKHGR